MNEITTLNAEVLARFEEKIAEYAKNPDPRLQEALQQKNINLVRSILKLDLNDVDVSFEELVLKTLYTFKVLPEVFEPFEYSKLHRDVDADENNWNEDYFLTQQAYLTLNYAQERLVHLAHVKFKLQGNKPSKSPTTQVVDRTTHKAETFNKDFAQSHSSALENLKQWVKDHPKLVITCVFTLALIVCVYLLFL